MTRKQLVNEIRELEVDVALLNHENKTLEQKNDELSKQKFNDWMIDNNMTELISGLTHERALMQDAVRNLGFRMDGVSTFLNAVSQRVPKAQKVIDHASKEI